MIFDQLNFNASESYRDIKADFMDGYTHNIRVYNVNPITVHGFYHVIRNEDKKEYDRYLTNVADNIWEHSKKSEDRIWYHFGNGETYLMMDYDNRGVFKSVFMRRCHAFSKTHVLLNGSIITNFEWKIRQTSIVPLQTLPLFILEDNVSIHKNTLKLAIAWEIYANILRLDGFETAYNMCINNKETSLAILRQRDDKAEKGYNELYFEMLMKVRDCFRMKYPMDPRNEIVSIYSKNTTWEDAVWSMKMKKIEAIGDDSWEY